MDWLSASLFLLEVMKLRVVRGMVAVGGGEEGNGNGGWYWGWGWYWGVCMGVGK